MSDEGLRRLAELCGHTIHISTDGAVVREKGATFAESWNPFHHIADAFEVVEALRKRGYSLSFRAFDNPDGDPVYSCMVHGVFTRRPRPRTIRIYRCSSSIQEAICDAIIAALAALDAEKEKDA